jgi:hypothetical protein
MAAARVMPGVWGCWCRPPANDADAVLFPNQAYDNVPPSGGREPSPLLNPSHLIDLNAERLDLSVRAVTWVLSFATVASVRICVRQRESPSLSSAANSRVSAELAVLFFHFHQHFMPV